MSDLIIIDVRTKEEFRGGHVKGSMNIPLQEIASHEEEILQMNKRIVFCCASGNRSGHATAYFLSKGVDCENGGSWFEVQAKLVS
jgi:rhodanese-related sulfurtransferase